MCGGRENSFSLNQEETEVTRMSQVLLDLEVGSKASNIINFLLQQNIFLKFTMLSSFFPFESRLKKKKTLRYLSLLLTHLTLEKTWGSESIPLPISCSQQGTETQPRSSDKDSRPTHCAVSAATILTKNREGHGPGVIPRGGTVSRSGELLSVGDLAGRGCRARREGKHSHPLWCIMLTITL